MFQIGIQDYCYKLWGKFGYYLKEYPADRMLNIFAFRAFL